LLWNMAKTSSQLNPLSNINLKDHTSVPQSKVDAKSPANKMTAVSKIKL
jgi:hypothetical protein